MLKKRWFYYKNQITPLQKDPKQQELRILLRPRWIYDPMKDSGKASFDQGPSKRAKIINNTNRNYTLAMRP